MGGRCCKFELSASASTEIIHAPAEVVWDIITNIESWPKFLSTLKEVKRINTNSNYFYYNTLNQSNRRRNNNYEGQNNNKKWREGTSWDEIRKFKGREFLCHKSITNLTTVCKRNGEKRENHHHNYYKNTPNTNKNITDRSNVIRSVGINVCYQPMHTYHPKNSTATTSFTLLPIDDKSCTLVASMGFVSEGFLQYINPERLILKRYGERLMMEFLQQEIDDYAKVAMAFQESTKRRPCFPVSTKPVTNTTGKTMCQKQLQRIQHQQRCQ